MASLTGSSIASTYKDLLQVSNSNSGIDGTARVVSDGEDTASKLFLDTNRVGVGIAPTEGTLHVHTATAGSITADGAADDLVVENSGAGGITILTPNNALGQLAFGSPADAYGAFIGWKSDDNQMTIATANDGDSIVLQTANKATALTIDSSQNATFASKIGIGVSPIGTLDINISTDARGSFNSSIGEVGSGVFALQVTNAAGSALKPMGIRAEDIRLVTGSVSALTLGSSGVATFGGDILPATDDAQDLGSSSKRFDDVFASGGVTTTSDQRLKDNIADSSLGLDFVNALRPVEYKFKDYTYDVEKDEAVEAIEAKEAVMGTRQKTVSKEVEKTRTEIVEEDGKYVQKEISYTETVEEPQYEEVNLYDEDGEVIGLHKIPITEEYEVEPATEAIEAKDAVMETKEKTFARTHFGLIAQEVEQVLKDSSLTNNDFAGLIYDEDADRYGIRYHELISPLIKAVQELSKKVTDLENK